MFLYSLDSRLCETLHHVTIIRSDLSLSGFFVLFCNTLVSGSLLFEAHCSRDVLLVGSVVEWLCRVDHANLSSWSISRRRLGRWFEGEDIVSSWWLRGQRPDTRHHSLPLRRETDWYWGGVWKEVQLILSCAKSYAIFHPIIEAYTAQISLQYFNLWPQSNISSMDQAVSKQRTLVKLIWYIDGQSFANMAVHGNVAKLNRIRSNSRLNILVKINGQSWKSILTAFTNCSP